MSIGESWPTFTFRAGGGGLNLGAIDAIPPTDWTRLSNVWSPREGEWTSRFGQTELAQAAGDTNIHSIGRLDAYPSGTNQRIWGANNHLLYGMSGVLTVAETDFSGNPLTLLPLRSAATGESWMYVADSFKMRKIRVDGTDLPLGLPAPGFGSLTATLNAPLIVPIEEFEGGFTGHNGTGGAPGIVYGGAPVGNGMYLTANPGAATGGFYNFASKPLALDLSTFGGGVPSTDEDIIHFYILMDLPARVSEVRIYLACSPYDANVIPGDGSSNTDAFMLSVQPSVYTPALAQEEPLRQAVARREGGAPTVDLTIRRGQPIPVAPTVNTTVEPVPTQPGANVLTQYGTLDLPLRKSEFLRIGDNPNYGWNTITGITVVLQVNIPDIAAIVLDNMYLQGGHGLDSSGTDGSPYDWRYTHYDTLTGVEGNPSPVMNALAYLSPLRGAATLTPTASPQGNVLQRFYRRGGGPATTQNWFFVGQNVANGAALVDDLNDDAIVAEATVEIDNNQPITTVASTGDPVDNVPLPVIFGPIQDVVFGLGDPYRPGFLYWSKPGNYDAWPARNNKEVCSATEFLQNGLIYGGQAYAWSQFRLWAIYPDLSGSGQVVVNPTACQRGILGRWAFCVGPDGMYAVDGEGVYQTSGGEPIDLSSTQLYDIFHGQAANGMRPINLGFYPALRLAFHAGELWFLYADFEGVRRVLIYNRLNKRWRPYDFAVGLSVVWPDVHQAGIIAQVPLLMGGATSGRAYTFEGTTDAGAEITCHLRTASVDLGQPRRTKQLGDLIMDFVRVDNSIPITITPYLNNETITLSPLVLPASTFDSRFTPLEPFGPTPYECQTIALDIVWTWGLNLFTAPPVIRDLIISYLPLPDTAITRATDWEDLGTPEAKVLKGLSCTIDTEGRQKVILVEATLDIGQVVVVDTIVLTSFGRRVVTRTWPSVRASLFRLRPTDANPWRLFDLQWIAETDALGRMIWEGLPTDHGISGWQTPLYGEICVRADAPVFVTLKTWTPQGLVNTQRLTLQGLITIPPGGPEKIIRYLPSIEAVKGTLFQWILDSIMPFWVYPKECRVWIQPWQGDPVAVQVLGLPDIQDAPPSASDRGSGGDAYYTGLGKKG